MPPAGRVGGLPAAMSAAVSDHRVPAGLPDCHSGGSGAVSTALPAPRSGLSTAAVSGAGGNLPDSGRVSAGSKHSQCLHPRTRRLQPAGGDVRGGVSGHRPRPRQSDRC